MSTTATPTLLPEEIIIEILSCVPANSLVSSFKFVCKAWRNLIKDPDFVKMHLNRGGGGGGGGGGDTTANSSSLICKYGKDLFQLHPPFNFEGLSPIAAAATKLDFDSFFSSPWNSSLVGSCNGLLCLRVDDDDDTIILLNPSTRRYKISPKKKIKYPKAFFSTGTIFGFGCCYNSIHDDDEYKVVGIQYFFGWDDGEYSCRYQVDIYSMSSNSWTTETTNIIDLAFNISHQQSGVFVNEALHWVAGCTDRNWDTIASFDIRDEEFRQVPIPLSCPTTTTTDCKSCFQLNKVILMNMKGCLSMIHFSHGTHGRRNIMDAAADLEIWVMKEYGIKESWTKEFVIRSWDTDPPRGLSDFEKSPRSNAYVLKGNQMLIEGLTCTKKGCWPSPEGFRKLVLYDINKRKIDGDFKKVGVPYEPDQPYYPHRVDQVDYIETLVSLKSSIMVHALDSNLSSSSS